MYTHLLKEASSRKCVSTKMSSSHVPTWLGKLNFDLNCWAKARRSALELPRPSNSRRGSVVRTSSCSSSNYSNSRNALYISFYRLINNYISVIIAFVLLLLFTTLHILLVSLKKRLKTSINATTYIFSFQAPQISNFFLVIHHLWESGHFSHCAFFLAIFLCKPRFL